MEKVIYLLIIGLVIFLGIKILSLPIKFIFRLALHAALGLLFLYIVNIIGSSAGFEIVPTPVTCLISGLLGVPGVLLLLLYYLVLI